MKPWLMAAGGFAIGVAGTLAARAVLEIWARLDRIEGYLSHVSQVLRG